jgi:hypothetical protein
MPNRFPASTIDVELKPAMYAARAARIPASMPCARRAPNSMTGGLRPPSRPRAARLATDVRKHRLSR